MNYSDLLHSLNASLHSFIWGPIMLCAFLFTGMLFTIRSGFFQFLHIRLWLKCTLFQFFRPIKSGKNQDHHSISQLQSCFTALAATIGTGNITGVATAIAIGGPGSVFWMWISALLGTMTAFAENVLGMKYRYRSTSGSWVGGAFIYIERGLGPRFKWMAVLFAILCVCSSFGIGNMTQANSIACGLQDAFQIDPRLVGILLMFLIGLVIFGGIRRIATVVEWLVPFMAILYILGGLIVILFHITNLPAVFVLIIREAFRPAAAGGGFLGYGMMRAMQTGISRGVFSNEAGLGSSVMAHCACENPDPIVQGMWGIFEVFVDTILMCSITAFVILCSGVYDVSHYEFAIRNGTSVLSGTSLAGAAFLTVLPYGDKLIALSILLFAFCTILGWSYFGECAMHYLFRGKHIRLYKVCYVFFLYIGCTSSLNLVWEISDTLNGLMAIPNLTALLMLSKEVISLTKNSQKKRTV